MPLKLFIKVASAAVAVDIAQGYAVVHTGAAMLEGAMDVPAAAAVVLAVVVAKAVRDVPAGFV